ncbi:MAG: hypothetical protein IJ859_09315 [Synergistaceae bacterium]|nr:hypothetical protein [Synergistaceae bacterium]
MTELIRATTGHGQYRSPNYWKVKIERRNGLLGIVRYDYQDKEIAFFVQGDANLLANSPEMHDMLWAILEKIDEDPYVNSKLYPLKKEIINLLARTDVEEPEGMPEAVVKEVVREAKRLNKKVVQ